MKATTRRKGSVDAPFEWNDRKLKAAFRIALGQDTRPTIAADLGIHPQTLRFWESFKEFQRKVDENRDKILQSTELHLMQGLSEQVFNLRHLINAKLRNKADQEKVPVERLLAEYRKYTQQIFEIQKGGKPISMKSTSDINVTHTGSVEFVEKLLEEAGKTGSRDELSHRLLEIAGEVISDKERALSEDEGEFPGRKP